jgi:hypothetical protein
VCVCVCWLCFNHLKCRFRIVAIGLFYLNYN